MQTLISQTRRAVRRMTATGWWWALAVVLAGCSHGTVTAPDEINASWDEISFISPQAEGRLSIDAFGRILLTGVSEPADPGILGPATWRQLESALRQADLEEIPASPSGGEGWEGPGRVAGCLRIQRGDSVQGFDYLDPGELGEPEARLVSILEQVWLHSFGPQPDERVDLIRVERLLAGHYAVLPAPAEYVIRDEDALLQVLSGALDEGHATVALPRIDFEQQMVLAVFLGPHDDEHVDLRFDTFATYSANGYLQVSLSRYVRDQSCQTPLGEGGAFEIVALPRVTGEVYWSWETVSVGCEGQTGLTQGG